MRLVEVNTEVSYIDTNLFKEEFQFKNFEFLKATHAENLPCYCFVFEDENDIIYYSADNCNIDYIKYYIKFENSTIYTEICNNFNLQNQHLYLPYLEAAVNLIDRKRVFLMHIDDSVNKEYLLNSGFNIPRVKSRKREK